MKSRVRVQVEAMRKDDGDDLPRWAGLPVMVGVGIVAVCYGLALTAIGTVSLISGLAGG